MKKIYSITLLLQLLLLPVIGEEFFIEEYDYSVYIPEGWRALDSSNLSELSFTSDDKTVVFQVSVFSGDTFKSAEEMFYDLTKGFNTGTKGSSFLFNGNDAYIVDISFISIQNNMRGWFLFVNKEDRDYYLLAFASLDYYDEKLPFILSVLDSFRIDTDESKLLPGAISQFYYPYPGNEEDTAQIEVGGNLVVFQTDINEFDASQLVIEREAVLMEYYQRLGDKNLFSKAWKRYYRMIFRDNYSRFDNLSNALKKEDIGKTDKEKAIVLLDWLQNFEYSSSDTFSDLLAPISSVCYEKGDCDARGLSYSILLKHLNIESLLLVSWQYSHSLSAVNIAGDGARYTFDDNTYLIAETTDNVDIGLIPQSMSDSEKWIPVSFF